MTITFALIIFVMVVMSILKPQKQDDRQHIEIDLHYFKVSPGFLAGAIIIFGILTGLYASFW
jgi:SSS family solute:Na+ symporter